MAVDSNTNSLAWDSSSSLLQSQSLSNIPNHYDLSIIAPLTLSQRKHFSHATLLQLPPLKLRSTLTWGSSEEEILLSQSATTTTERESTMFRQRLDRLRATLSQSLESNRHTLDKMHYKKSSTLQTISEREEIINQLLKKSFQLNEKVKEWKNELINQRHQRDNHEMRQSKLRRELIRLNKNKDKTNEILKTNDKAKLIEQCETRLLNLKNACQQEITDLDQQIDELKDKLSDEFNYQSDEHLKFINAVKQAFHLESQKCNILQEYVDAYENHVYRARKPCCTSTSLRLNQISTQLRLYLIMELTLHELLHSPCSCGPLQRSYQTFLRLHQH